MTRKPAIAEISLLADINYSAPSAEEIQRVAHAYRKAGLSLIPVLADGTKRPDPSILPRIVDIEQKREIPEWRTFTQRQPTSEEIDLWFYDPDGIQPNGMAIVGGEVSGGLEIVDLDNEEVIGPWEELVEREAPGLLGRLVRVRTPRPGQHVYYRCSLYGGSQKLASKVVTDPHSGARVPKTLIEVKGEGGYCLAPPSPAHCHQRRRCYVPIGDRDLTQVPEITPEERQVLFDAARLLNQWHPAKAAVTSSSKRSTRRRSGENRPGDDFNENGDWREILEPHGWTLSSIGPDDVQYWRRPGSSHDHSATVDYRGSGLLYVFSTSASPFETETSYTKFHAYTLLNHQGNFTAAAKALAKKGYGKSLKKKKHRRKPRSRTQRNIQ